MFNSQRNRRISADRGMVWKVISQILIEGTHNKHMKEEVFWNTDFNSILGSSRFANLKEAESNTSFFRPLLRSSYQQ